MADDIFALAEQIVKLGQKNQLNPQDQDQLGQKHDPPGAPVGPYGHGQGGLFSVSGVDPRIFSAMSLPVTGIADALPVLNGGAPSGDQFGGEDFYFQSVLTGVTKGALADIDNQPTAECADGPVGGLTKLCTFVNTYGQYKASTREINIIRAGQRRDLADPLTLQLMGGPQLGGFGVPQQLGNFPQGILTEMSRRLSEMAIDFKRMISGRVWAGNPVNNNGQFRDMMGLDLHINVDTHIDKDSQQTCKAANSDIKNFAYNNVGGNVLDIVEFIEMMDYYLSWNAEQQGLEPWDYWLVMRPQLWRILSSRWPVQQHMNALVTMANYNNGRVMVDARAVTQERDALRQSKRLPISGTLRDVIVDSTLPEETSATTASLVPGQFASPIVFVPKTVLGGVPVTYFRTFNHANDNSEFVANFMRQFGGAHTFTSDGGAYRWFVAAKNECLKMNMVFNPQLIMHTPQLAGRIEHVMYEPLQHVREWDPDSDYHFNGGRTSSEPIQFYAGWSPSAPLQG